MHTTADSSSRVPALDDISRLSTDDDLDPVPRRGTADHVDRLLAHAVGFGVVLRHADHMHHRAEPFRQREGRRQPCRASSDPVERNEHLPIQRPRFR